MRRLDVRRAIRRAVFAAMASAAGTAAAGCSCANAIVVSPLGDAALPDGVSGFVGDRQLSTTECAQLCSNRATRCQVVRLCNDPTCPTDAGPSSASSAPLGIACEETAICQASGRRPEGFELARIEHANPAHPAAYFAIMSELESASVTAFRRLADELRSHGAPASLVADAVRSARDEVQHAHVTSQLADAFGGRPAAKHEARHDLRRSLVAIAIENAIEGCVRETFGAAVAAWQAEHAMDPRVRTAMQSIARDEARHAALAWQVAHWMESRLDDGEREVVTTAMRAAIGTLRCENRTSADADLVSLAGVPDAARASAMIDELEVLLWSA
jgi:hypothetical protein